MKQAVVVAKLVIGSSHNRLLGPASATVLLVLPPESQTYRASARALGQVFQLLFNDAEFAFWLIAALSFCRVAMKVVHVRVSNLYRGRLHSLVLRPNRVSQAGDVLRINMELQPRYLTVD
jgi:hypothetical protein